jgi:Cof subfamily protein (haloacid dehalogenase superfamily)
MPVKLIAIDMDGTLLTKHKIITPAVFTAIKKVRERGIKIVITTGRPFLGVLPYIDELNLREPDNFVITYNGALAQEIYTGEEFVRYPLSYDDFLELETLSRKIRVHMHSITNDAIYTSNRDISWYTAHEVYRVKMPFFYRTPEEMNESLEIIKIMYVDVPETLFEAVAKIPPHVLDRFSASWSAPYYYEFINKNANKGVTLKKLSEKLGVRPDDIMAIGDNGNDLSMIEFAGIGVAMGNATDAVKERAQIIGPSNEEDGVARILEKYVLGE